MHKVFVAVKRFRCLTAVWYSICVGYLQFNTSMCSADTAYCSFPVAQCIPHIPKPSWPNGVSFSLGPKGNSYHVTTLLSTKIIFQGSIPAFFFLPPPSFFFTLLYFNASSSSTVLIRFFSTKRRKLPEENQLLLPPPKKKNNFFSSFRFMCKVLTVIKRLWVLRQVLLGCIHWHKIRFGTPESFGSQFQFTQCHCHMIMWV